MTTLICTMCENPVHNEFQEHNANIQPSGGLHLAIHTGYGMMADPMDEASFQALTSICLCHDCSIKVIDMFPQEFKDNFFAGGHPLETCRAQSDTHPDGCHYSWC